jgi:hypothetical protein
VLIWGVLTLVLAIAILVPIITISSCGGNQANELLNKAIDAAPDMSSYHMSLVNYGDSQDLGKVKAEELVADVEGENVHVVERVFDASGQLKATEELIKIGDTQYLKDPSSGAWSVDQATVSKNDISDYTSSISSIVGSNSGKVAGEEEVNGTNTKHLVFTLTPAQVSSVAGEAQSQEGSSSPANFDFNKGGQIDFWVDPLTNFAVRYEMVFKNVWTPQTSYIDVWYTVDITNINQPINITPPI